MSYNDDAIEVFGMVILIIIIGIIFFAIGCNLGTPIRHNIDARVSDLGYTYFDKKENKTKIKPNIKIINGDEELSLEDFVYFIKNNKMEDQKCNEK